MAGLAAGRYTRASGFRTTIYLRTYNEDPSFAPAGHTVVQVMAPTSYEAWAQMGTRYQAAKEQVADDILQALAPSFSGIEQAVEVIDVATPLTFWRSARSWRGAYEGWFPRAAFTHVAKTFSGLHELYLAGQWVEPGGGVPTAVMSGRQAVQLLCADRKQPFVVPSRVEKKAPPPAERRQTQL